MKHNKFLKIKILKKRKMRKVFISLALAFGLLNPLFILSQTLELEGNPIICGTSGTTTITTDVSGSGSGNIVSYEWEINNTPVSNTNSSIEISALTGANNPQEVTCTVTLNNGTVLSESIEVYTLVPSISGNECLNNGGTGNMTVSLNPSLPSGYSVSYSWSGPSGFSGTGTSVTVPNFGPSNVGTYTVEATISEGGNSICSSEADFELDLNPANPNFTIPSSGCQGTPYSVSNFTPQNGVSYTWSTSPASNSTGLSSNNPNLVFTSGGQNTVTVVATSSSDMCTSSSSDNIALPNFNANPPFVEVDGNYFGVSPANPNTIPVCLGLDDTPVNIENNLISDGGFTNPAGVTYTYSLNGSPPAPIIDIVQGTIFTGDNPLIISATYQGCTQSINVNVYLGSNPFVSLGTSNSLGMCPGTSLEFSINPEPQSGQSNPPGTTYTVFYSDTPGQTDQFIDLAGTTTVNHVYNTSSCGATNPGTLFPTNTFYAQVTASNFCGETVSSVSPITVNAFPIAAFNVSDSTICAGQNVTVTNTGSAGSVIGNSSPYNCTSQGKFYWTIDGGVAGVDYNLTGNLGFYNTNYFSLASNGSDVLNIQFLNPGYYTISQIYYNSCGLKTKVRNICVIEAPVAEINYTTDSSCSPVAVNLSASAIAPTCNGTPIPLSYTWTVSGPSGTSASYTNNTGQTPPELILTNTSSSPQNFTITLVVNPKEPGNPSQNFATPNCFTTVSESITVNPIPVLNPVNIASCDNPYQVAEDLNAFCNIPNCSFTWFATSNTNVTGETLMPVQSDFIDDLLENTTSGVQTVVYSISATSPLGCISAPENFDVALNSITGGTISESQTICAGTSPAALTGTSPAGGGTQSIQWQSSSDNVSWVNIPGATSANYSPPVLNNNTYFRRTVSFVLNGVACSTTSNVVEIMVNAVNAGGISSSQNLCTGDDPNPLNFSTIATGSGNLSYQWQSSPAIGGPWNNIAGANGQSYDPPVLTSTTDYRVSVSSTLNGLACSTNSNTVTIQIFDLTPGSIAADQEICVGGNPSLLSSVNNPSSTGTTLSHQWQQSTDNLNWTNIPGATSLTYDPPSLSATTYFRRQVNASLSGNLICSGYSNEVEITVVDDPIVSSPSPNSQTICAGATPEELTVNVSGGISSNYLYQWYSAPNSLIPGATSESFTPPSNSGTYFCEISINPALSGCNATSTNATVTVIPDPVVSSPLSATYCQDEPNVNVLTVSANGGISTNYSYQWFSNTTNSTIGGVAIPGADSDIYLPDSDVAGTFYFYCVVSNEPTSVTGCSTVSSIAEINILPTPEVNPIADFSVCDNQSSLAFNFNGIATSYNWTNDNVNTGIGAGANNVTQFESFNATNPSIIPISSIIEVTPLYVLNGVTCQGNSTSFTVTVSSGTTVDPVPNQDLCNNDLSTEVIFTGNVAGVDYNWSSSNTAIGLAASSGTNTIPVFTATNTTGDVISSTITITPTTQSCSGSASNFVITVNPTPNITNAILVQELCPGPTAPVIWESNLNPSLSPTFDWVLVSSGPNITGTMASGSGDLPSFNLINSGTTPEEVVYAITPSYLGCVGNTINYTYTINPGPEMDPILPQEICSGEGFTTPVFSSAVQGINYSWDLTNVNIPAEISGFPHPNGTGDLTGTIITNSGDQAYTLIYEVTPNIAGLCSGAPVIFELSVQPAPETTFNITDQTICTGTNSQAIQLSSITPNVQFEWSATIPSAISGVSQTAGNSNEIPSFDLNNSSNSPLSVEFTATASIQNSNCSGVANIISITVLPIPEVDPISDLAVCSGTMTSAIPFTGTATSFNWQNDNVNTGITNAASGVLDFASFMPSNSSAQSISSSITVVPIFSLNNINCSGDSLDFLIHVNPTGQVNPIPSIEICSGSNQSEILFSTLNSAGTTTYDWTNSNNSIGLGANGSGNIPAFIAQNNTATPNLSQISVLPTLILNGISCPGPIETFEISVAPVPQLDPIPDQIICNNQLSNAVNFPGSGFNEVQWSNSLNSIGLAATGAGNIPPFTVVNNTLDIHVATISSTPYFNSPVLSCPGAEQSFTITVSPTPNVDPVGNQTVCHGDNTNPVVFSGNVQGVNYSWVSNIDIGLNPLNGVNSLPAFTATNNTDNITIADFVVTPSSLGCPGVPTSFSIQVNPIPQINNGTLNQVICPGPSDPVSWTTNLDPALTPVFSWSLISAGPNISGQITNGTGALPSMVLSNNGNSPQNVSYSVTPSFMGCEGTPVTYTISVNPGPEMDVISGQEICSGELFNTTAFSSSVVGLTYSWTLSNVNIPAGVSGFPQPSGTGNIQGSIVENTSSSAVDLIYEVVPAANGCSGNVENFVLTVHPELLVNFSMPNQTICDGSTSTIVNLSSNASNALINWELDSIPQGILGLNVLTGTSSIPPYNLVNTTTQEIVITFTIQAIDQFDNTLCPGESYNYSITVLPAPFVNSITDQLVCHGNNTLAVNFTGTGTSYEWVSDLPNIGMGANGSNNIPAFVAQNTQSTTISAEISVTPMFLLNGVNCLGPPEQFSISVNPSGQINPILDIVVCNDEPVASVPFISSNLGGSNTYFWNNSNTTTGLNGGDITAFTPAFTAQNTGVLANISVVTVTPTFTNFGLSCPGPAIDFSITVNPTPEIFSTSDTIICNETPLFLAPTTNVTSIYEWQGSPNAQVLGITTNIQNGPGIDETLNNISDVPQDVSYTITPISSPQGCYGAPSTFIVTVQPEISIASQTNFEICSGTLFDAVLTSNIPATFNWFATINPNITGASTIGNSGNVINDVLVNTSNSPQQVVYTVLPTSVVGDCPGDPLIINVLVNPELQITNPNTEAICSDEQLSLLLTANAPGTFSWFAQNNGNVTGATTSIQNSNVISDQLVNLSNSVQQVQYNVVITSNNDGCTSQNYPVIIEVSPEPIINPIANIVACDDQTVAAQIPSGVFTSFNWSNNNTLNGLSGSGTNASQIPSFTAQNTNNFPLNSQITLTPIFTNNGLSCSGNPSVAQLIVNPTGQLNQVNSFEVCNNQNVSSVVFSTQNILGNTTYSWTNNNINIGLNLTSGNGNVPSFVSSNSTNQPISATISSVATFTNQGVSCPSLPASYNLTVNPTAQVNPLSDLNFCVGDLSPVVPFSGLSASSFTWSNSNNAIGLGNNGSGNLPTFTATNVGNNVIQGVVTVTGVYNSSTSSLSCPGDSENFTISVSPSVFVNAIPNQTICLGQSSQLVNFSSNVVGANYTWTNSNTGIGLAPSSGLDFLPAFNGINNTTTNTSTTISVTGSINGCPGNPQNFQIEVNPNPQIINPIAQQTICSGDQSQEVIWQNNLTNGIATTYTWSIQNPNPNVSGVLTNGIGNLPPLTLVNSTSTVQSIAFTVIPTSDGCNGPAFTYTIFVSPTPAMNPIQPVTICSGDFFNGAVFSSNIPGANYNWSLQGLGTIPATVSGYPSPSGVGAIPGSFINNTGSDFFSLNYVVTPVVGSCSGSPEIIEVTIIPNPTINFSIPVQEICSSTNSNAVLISSPTAATQLTWNVTNPPAGVSGLNITSGTDYIPEYLLSNNLAAPQVITFSISGIVSGLGCSSQENYSITVLPVPTTQAQNAEICSEDQANVVLNSNQNTTYVWSATPNPNIGGASINSQNTGIIDDQLTNLTVNPQLQEYTIQSFLSPQGCPGDIIQTTILVNPLPNSEFTISNPCDSDTIFFTNLSNPSDLFLWNFDDGSTSFQFEPWHIYDQNGTYNVSLQVTDVVTGCMKTSTNPITIPDLPTFVVDTTHLCSYGQFTFTNLTQGSYSNVVWEFGDGTSSIEPNFANHVYVFTDCYDVTLSLESEGCPYSVTIEDMVCILPNPVASFVVPENIQSYNNNLFTFENLSQNALYYHWDFGDGSTSNAVDPVHTYNSEAGIYGVTLVATNEFGCADTTKFSIQLSEDLLVYVPNAFTPNGDVTNGVFKPIITEGIDIFTYRLLIYDRWGEVLFESRNKEVGWDGTYGGKIVQDGVYIWKVNFNSINDEEEYEYIGHVTLIR